ncbi:MAG: hypothetical protein HUJ51_03160 [Eggerthellaceae bacterium]|nr:hypothetical protein [Eggerthellaceae bacterium]
MKVNLLITEGQMVAIIMLTIFGPEPEDLAEVAFKKLKARRIAYSAEDLCKIL